MVVVAWTLVHNAKMQIDERNGLQGVCVRRLQHYRRCRTEFRSFDPFFLLADEESNPRRHDAHAHHRSTHKHHRSPARKPINEPLADIKSLPRARENSRNSSVMMAQTKCRPCRQQFVNCAHSQVQCSSNSPHHLHWTYICRREAIRLDANSWAKSTIPILIA